MEGAMDVLIVEPGKSPYMSTITGDIASLQKVVGGYIEGIEPYDDPVAIICNEEGKMKGLPPNRNIGKNCKHLTDIIVGTFMVCGIEDEDYASLSPELAEKYREKFKNPEVFMRD
jgi:Domain of unknown function (DUF3846)